MCDAGDVDHSRTSPPGDLLASSAQPALLRGRPPARRAATVVALSCAALLPVADPASAVPVPHPYQLTVLAGSSVEGRPTAGPATSSRLHDPLGVAVDASGAVRIADAGNHVVVEVDTSTPPDLSVIAGDGVGFTTFLPTPGPATSSKLTTPAGVAVDRWGNTYVTDAALGKVVRIDTASPPRLSVIAGDMTRPWTSGAPTPGGPATSSLLRQPLGLAVDHDGDVYIADSGNNVVEKVDAVTGTLTVVAGDGTAFTAGTPTPGALATSSRLDAPAGVAVDAAGNLFIADTGNNVVSKVDATTGRLSIVAGDGSGWTSGPPTTGGPATASKLFAPNGVAVDGAGNVYIADTRNNVVEKVDASGRLSIIAGGRSGFGGGAPVAGPATGSDLGYPTSVAVDAAGAVYVSEWGSDVVVVLTPPPGTLPRVTSPPPPSTTGLGVAYSSAATVSAETSLVTWSTSAGSLPPGLSLDATTGAITGVPAAVGSWSFVLRATTSAGYDTQAATITVTAPAAGPAEQLVRTSAPTSVPLRVRTFALNASASGPGGGVAGGALTYASATPALCTADAAGTVTLLAVGRCTVRVTAAATATGARTTADVTTTVTAADDGAEVLPPGPQRLAGAGRVGTAANTAAGVFSTPAAGACRDVVVATAASWADSLAGARLAGQVGGPLLLTDGRSLSPEAAAQVQRLAAAGGTVHLLGGESAVSADVERDLDGLVTGGAVVRLGGADRYETAVAVAGATTRRAGDVGPIYLVTGRDFPDGVSAAAFAQSTGGVVLLTDGDAVPAATEAYLAEHDPGDTRAVAVGGPAVRAAAAAGLSGAVRRSVAGTDRFATSAELAEQMSGASSSALTVGLAGGASWPDALSGAAAMAALGGPLLLTPTDSAGVPLATASVVERLHPRRLVVFGGPAAVSEEAYRTAGTLLRG